MPLHLRPIYVGLLGAIELAAQDLGPFLGGVLVDALSWRWCFSINLPCGGVSLILASILLPYFSSSERNIRSSRISSIAQLDWIGLILFTGFTVALLLALQLGGGRVPWTNFRLILALALFSILASAIGFWHFARKRETLLPSHVLKVKGVAFAATFGYCAGSGLSIIENLVCLQPTQASCSVSS